MSQFKKTGAFFCSTFGGSALNAGTALAPYAHPTTAPSSTTNRVVCSGSFKGGWAGTRVIVADGPCVIDLLGSTVTMDTDKFSPEVGSNPERDFIHVKNGALTGASGYKNVVLENVSQIHINANNGSFLAQRMIYLPNSFNLITQVCSFLSLQNSLVFENVLFSNISFSGRITRCYLDKDKYFEFQYLTVPTTAQWNSFGPIYCILNGRIVVNGVNYELKRLKDGTTRPDANPDYTDFLVIYPNVYTTGNYAGDMKFINILKRKVHPDSDVFHNAINFDTSFGWIGGVSIGRYVKPDDANFQYSYSSNIDSSNPLSLKTAVGQPFGKIRITGKVSNNLITGMTIDFSSILKYDATILGGVPNNNNVPDASREMGLTLGDFRPRRFTFKARFSSSLTANQASPDSVWDNDQKVGAGNWMLFEFNKALILNLKGGVHYGNADYRGFVADSIVNFQFRSIDIEVILDQEWDIV